MRDVAVVIGIPTKYQQAQENGFFFAAASDLSDEFRIDCEVWKSVSDVKMGCMIVDKHDPAEPELLDIVVRFDDPDKIFELKRAIFGLVCQTYRPIAITVVTPRFSADSTQRLADALAPTLALDVAVDLHIENYSEFRPIDARSAMLNHGLRKVTGRYLAFLDHDGVTLPQGYCDLISELRSAQCAVAFGGIAVKDGEVCDDALLVERRSVDVLNGRNVVDLFYNYFYPINSFVVDRKLIDRKDLWFDESLGKLEDYDFLLRVCAQYASSFRLIDRVVGDLYGKNDGTNALYGKAPRTKGWMSDWSHSIKAVEKRKESLIVSAPVQRLIGILPATTDMTVASLLKLCGMLREPGNAALGYFAEAEHVTSVL